MDQSDILFLPITQLGPLLAARKLSPTEVLRATLDRIAQLNPQLNAFLTVTTEEAHEDAVRAEREIAHGRYRGPLHGIPIAVKDNIWSAGVRTTAGSKILSEFVPEEDATVLRRLRKAGAILIGKTNLSEFAYGVSTNNAHFGPTHNPWDVERITGGSSGGSAAAVSASMTFAAIGSDTGGSIRIPAAMCGVVGLKPTYGRVSCFGLIPLAPSFDHVGPLCRTVADTALVLQILAGHDPRDKSTVRKRVPDYSLRIGIQPRKIRLGWPKEYFFERLHEEVRAAVEAAARHFERIRFSVEEISLPHLAGTADSSSLLALVEASNIHKSVGYYPRLASDYGDDVRGRLEMGTKVTAVDYLEAVRIRNLVRADFETALSQVDAILAPTVPVPAPKIGASTVDVGPCSEALRPTLLRLNRPASMAGLPAISLPCGVTGNGLPVGLQIIGRAFDERGLLRIANAYEHTTEWHLQRPRKG